jgi:hypothetical protein
MVSNMNYYEILGFETFQSVNAKEVMKAAYNALDSATDLFLADKISSKRLEELKEGIKVASEVLSDDCKRWDYMKSILNYSTSLQVLGTPDLSGKAKAKELYLKKLAEAKLTYMKDVAGNLDCYFKSAANTILELDNKDTIEFIVDIVEDMAHIPDDDGGTYNYKTNPTRFNILMTNVLKLKDNSPLAEKIIEATVECNGIKELETDTCYEKAIKLLVQCPEAKEELWKFINRNVNNYLRIGELDTAVSEFIDKKLAEKGIDIEGNKVPVKIKR